MSIKNGINFYKIMGINTDFVHNAEIKMIMSISSIKEIKEAEDFLVSNQTIVFEIA